MATQITKEQELARDLSDDSSLKVGQDPEKEVHGKDSSEIDQQKPEPREGQPSPPPPPNGGLKAWLQVVGGFMLFLNTWGILNTFGVYQTYYESGQLFSTSSSNISWIGSLQSFFLLLTGVLSGSLYDRGYLPVLLLVGTFLVVFGHMMLSLCQTYWQVVLAQSLVIGIGSGCLFVPAVAILPTYFTTKVATAIGLAASGSSVGGIIYPIVFYRLIEQIGFPWSVRVLGFMTLATLVIPIFVMQTRVKPPRVRALLDLTAFKDLHYLTFVFGTMLAYAGLYVGLFYLSYFGLATGLTGQSLSFYLVAIMNSASVFGRTLPNILADKIGPLNVLLPGVMTLSVILFCLLAVHAAGSLIILVVLFGFFSGFLVALPPACYVSLTADKSKIGTRMGMGNALIGLGILAGGPGGGRILQHSSSELHWTRMWAFAGAMTMAAALVYMVLRIMRAGLKSVKC